MLKWTKPFFTRFSQNPIIVSIYCIQNVWKNKSQLFKQTELSVNPYFRKTSVPKKQNAVHNSKCTALCVGSVQLSDKHESIIPHLYQLHFQGDRTYDPEASDPLLRICCNFSMFRYTISVWPPRGMVITFNFISIMIITGRWVCNSDYIKVLK